MQKQNVNINFSKGVNSKVDPWQIPIGQFDSLVNMVFQTPLLLGKRDGYATQLSLDTTASYLTTLNGNLITIGTGVKAYSSSNGTLLSRGNYRSCLLSVLPLIRNNFNQIQADTAISSNLVCVVATYTYGQGTGLSTHYIYSIEDETTGESIVGPSSIPVLATGSIVGSSKVFVVGNFFVIITPVSVSAVDYLQYVSIPINNPQTISAAQNVYNEAYIPVSSAYPSYDGVVTNNNLVIAYNTTAGAQGIHVVVLTASQISTNSATTIIHNFTNAAYIGSVISTCVDLTASPNLVYVSFWNSATSNGYTCGITYASGTITVVFAPVIFISSVQVGNITSCAQNGVATVFSEVVTYYNYDATIPTYFIEGITVTNAGSLGSGFSLIRSCGIAAKAFIVDSIQYVVGAYQSTFQSTYFVINATSGTSAAPLLVTKIAYQNGGGYSLYGLPSVTVTGDIAQFAYFYKQNITALTSVNNSQQLSTGGIYSQLGVNLASVTLDTTSIVSAEIADNLQISGGFSWMYDGYQPVEQNFFLFPDNVEAVWTANSAVTPTGTWANGATVITVSSASGISPGMTITDTPHASYIPAGTTVVYVSGTSVTISQATTHSATTDTLSIQGNVAAKPDSSTTTNAYYYQVTYEWTDMVGNIFRSTPSIPVAVTTSGSGTAGIITVHVPTLRITQKPDNTIKIVIYRWSVQTQVYNQVTSVFFPIVSESTVDEITFVDTNPDSSITGNNLIYTTGGVVPNTNAPASSVEFLFDTRFCLVDAENPNNLWVSKTVIPNTPVEMSSFFTIYVAPNVGTNAPTGPISAGAPMDDKAILFRRNAIQYINGTGPDNLGTTSSGSSLGNYSQPIFITSIVGCSNQKSIALSPVGLMFQSADKGIWLLRRDLGTQYIGAEVERYNSSVVTSAFNIPGSNYVVFTLNTGQILMYDYYVEQWATFEGASAISSCIYNNKHTILTPNSQILMQTSGVYTDGTNPVLFSFTTGWINLASLQGYQRFTQFYILAKYLSPHTLNVGVSYDYNTSIFHNSTITPTNFSPSVPSSFGVPTPFGSPLDLEQWRIHAKQQLCQSFKLKIQEVFDPSKETAPGAGFTMSGMNCEIGIKKGMRPIRGSNAVG